MTTTESQSIAFNSPLNKWNDIIFIVLMGLLGIALLTFLNFGGSSGWALMITISGFAVFYGVRYYTKALTTITVNKDQFTISQSSRRLNKYTEINLALSDVRGFEIAEVTRGVRALLIYDSKFRYYKYAVLKTSEEFAIKDFLSQHLKQLDKKSNPLFSSFGAALLFALKRMLVFLFCSLSTIAAIYWLCNTYHIWLVNNIYLIPLTLFISLCYWWFLVRIPLQKHYFRFGAYYWLSNIFLYGSVFLFFPIKAHINRVISPPLAIERSFDVFKHEPAKIYIIKKTSYALDSILISDYYIKSRNKNGNYPIYHQFATPLGSGDTIKKVGLYNLWLVKSYQQNTKRTFDFSDKINSFHQQSKEVFLYSFDKEPTFYKLIDDNDIHDMLNRSYNASKKRVLLEPHWESISTYKTGLKKEMSLMFLALTMLNLIGCLIIASNK